MSPTHDAFGQLLRTLRHAAGLTQEQLALAAGLSVRSVANLEHGRTPGPQRRTVQALARALELDTHGAQTLESAAAPGRQRPRPTADHTTPGHLTLPGSVHDFTARCSTLRALEALAEASHPACPPVALVTGAPGLGKTAFAVHAAHHLTPRFPHGQLHLDLRGMDPEPVRPGDALARLLAAMGITGPAVPQSVEDRSALFRSATAKRRALLVLDNAADEAQIRPLLPRTGSCLTIVTSRNSLAGLESVHQISLPLLRREEGVELLTRILGADRVAQEAQAARDLADLCAGLPLALRIIGQRLAARPHETLAKLAAQLDHEERRLDFLRAGDLQIRAAFTLSYQQLDSTARLLLRRCSLAAGPDTSPETAVLLADLPLCDTRLGLDELCDRGLLHSDPIAERYRFHDLLRLFAAEQSETEDGEAARTAALDRTARWMLARATTAALHFDAEHHTTPTGDPHPATAPAGRDRARAWLEAERDQWTAALRHAHTAGWHQQVVDTAQAMHWFSDLTEHWPQWIDIFQCSADSARALGSPGQEATHLNYLAWAHSICAHQPQSALEAADKALAAARAGNNQLQTGWALGYGAAALHRLGRTDEAIPRLRASAACHHTNPAPQARLAELTTLNTLGETLRQHGQAHEALEHHLHSLKLCQQDHPGIDSHQLVIYQAVTLRHLGNDYAALGKWHQAETSLRQALTVFEATNSPGRSGPVQLELGRVLIRLGRPGEARTNLRGAVDTLAAHQHPLQNEATAELRALDHAHC
ncbi:ATP-binding protein [Streptomyces sp. NPDC003860]